jgi:phosphoglucosamine mutase
VTIGAGTMSIIMLDTLIAEMPMMPQVLVNVRFSGDTDSLSSEAVQAALREAETALEVGTEIPTGRVLLRKSGTEPLIRVMFEAESDAQKWAQHIADQVSVA